MKIFYGKGAYRRANGNLPELKLINMHVEPSPTDEEGVVLLSRNGLGEVATTGTGSPVLGVFQQDGVLGGDYFAITGDEGPVSFATSPTELGFCAGGTIYRYDGTTFAAVAFPDSAYVSKLLYHDGQFFALRADTGEWYASGVLDLATWDALAFKSAESKPDNLLDAEFLADAIYLFGQNTIEPWDNDGSGNSVPYTRRELSIIEKGIRATGCVVNMDQALWFVSNENSAMVIRGGAPQRVSDHGIEERIAASATCSCFGYVLEGHSFFCIRLDSGTWGMDIATNEWCEFQTLGLDNAMFRCATPPGETPVFGGHDGKLYRFFGWRDGDYPLERRFTAAIPLTGGAMAIDTVSVQANVGWTESLLGQGATPQVEMRTSRDAGATWGPWKPVSLGAQGDYRTRARWRRNGVFDEPGALIEFRTTDPVGFRISSVLVNEPGGGRSR